MALRAINKDQTTWFEKIYKVIQLIIALIFQALAWSTGEAIRAKGGYPTRSDSPKVTLGDPKVTH